MEIMKFPNFVAKKLRKITWFNLISIIAFLACPIFLKSRSADEPLPDWIPVFQPGASKLVLMPLSDVRYPDPKLPNVELIPLKVEVIPAPKGVTRPDWTRESIWVLRCPYAIAEAKTESGTGVILKLEIILEK